MNELFLDMANVVINGYNMPKMQAIKSLREALGLTLAEATDSINRVPVVILKNIEHESAVVIKSDLERRGFIIQVK